MKIKNFKLKIGKNGFTLIELLLVTAIIVVLGAAVSGFFFGSKTGIEAEEESLKIANVVKNARAKAIAMEENASWGVYFENGADSYYDFFYGPGHLSGTTTEKFYLPEGLAFEAPPEASSTEIVFAKRTGALVVSSTINIIIKSNNQTGHDKTITISPNGLVSSN